MIQNYTKKELSEIVTKEQIIALGGIYFNNIQVGFETCDYFLLEETKEEILKELKRLRDINGMESSYVDFYYGKLTIEEKSKLKDGLGHSFIAALEKYEDLQGIVFVPLNDEILNLTAELNAKEILFSSYYFCKYPCTIWGNYNLKYPVFTKRGSGRP